MKRVGRDASLDEASVQDAEQRQAEWVKPRPRTPRTPRSRVTIITVDPGVWAEAMRVAGGDASRLEVISPHEVVVHNGPWRNKKKGIR